MRQFQKFSQSAGLFGLILNLSFLLTGCGDAKQDTKSVDAFFDSNVTMIRSQAALNFASGKYQYLLHIHFHGNDFGAFSGKETLTDLAPAASNALRRKFSPLLSLHLSDSDAAYKMDFNYKNPQLLGRMEFRYKSGERALRALKTLFGCSPGNPAGLANVYLVATGGSHGGGELNDFNQALRSQCGKEPELLVFGDAIQQPLSFPLGKVDGLGDKQTCINFFQSNPMQFLHGTSIDNCINVKIKGWADATHDRTQQSGNLLMIRVFHEWEYNSLSSR